MHASLLFYVIQLFIYNYNNSYDSIMQYCPMIQVNNLSR